MFNDKASREVITIAIAKATAIMCDKNFYREISEVKSFTHTEDASCEIFEHIKFTFEIYNIDVVTYKSRNPWSKANGYTKKRKPFKIYVNTRKINKRSVNAWVGFLIHETCHLAGYSHGSNSPKGKENSVPYKVGSIAKRMAGEI